MSQIVLPPTQQPRKTFFVSSVFSGVNPFFNTIQSAIDAADGVLETTIVIYQGDYNITVPIVPKHNVHLQGIGREAVRVFGATRFIDYTGANINFSVENMRTDNTLGSEFGIVWNITSTAGNRSLIIRNSEIRATGTALLVLRVDTSTLAIVEDSTLASSRSMSGNRFHAGDKFENVVFTGFVQYNNAGTAESLRMNRCTLGGMNGNTGTTLIASNCVFNQEGSQSTDLITESPTRIFNNCSFVISGTFFPNLISSINHFHNCSFASRDGSAYTFLFCLAGSTAAVKFHNCSFKDVNIETQSIANEMSFFSVMARYTGATAHFVQATVAATVLMGNCGSNKILVQMPAVLAVASFNNNQLITNL